MKNWLLLLLLATAVVSCSGGDSEGEDQDAIEVVEGDEEMEDEDGEFADDEEGDEDYEGDEEGEDEEFADDDEDFEDEEGDEFEDEEDEEFADEGDEDEDLEEDLASGGADEEMEEEVVEEESEEMASTDSEPMTTVADDVAYEDNSLSGGSDSYVDPAPAGDSGSFAGGNQAALGTKSYTVQKNETLMMIAFKLYGDYRRWRDIAEINGSALGANNSVREGQSIQYRDYGDNFVWDPKGNPYLIKWGDTLGTISNSVYGTLKRWKEIWYNNRPLIKDPNKIFAGFTIFYIPDNEVASNL